MNDRMMLLVSIILASIVLFIMTYNGFATTSLLLLLSIVFTVASMFTKDKD